MLNVADTKLTMYNSLILLLLFISGFSLILLPRIYSVDQANYYLLTNSESFFCGLAYVIVSGIIILLPKLMQNDKLVANIYIGTLIIYTVIIVGAFYLDIFYLYHWLQNINQFNLFGDKLCLYLSQESEFYSLLIIGLLIKIIAMRFILYQEIFKTQLIKINYWLTAIILLVPIAMVLPLELINFNLFRETDTLTFSYLPFKLIFLQNLFYFIVTTFVIAYAYRYRNDYTLKLATLKKLINLAGMMAGFTLLVKLMSLLLPYLILSQRVGDSIINVIHLSLSKIGTEFLSHLPVLFMIAAIAVFKQIIRNKLFSEVDDSSQITGNFGTACFASHTDLIKLNAYDSKNGIAIGKDEKDKLLYLPLYNKLTISPPGGGKTTASSILALLTHVGSVFVWDIKGELWAVTARYRAEVLKRKVIVIDPYKLTKSPDFAKGKNAALLKEYRINPFDWIPEDKKERDRILNTFAASFVINEGGFATHFDENAKILIRGYIDYLMNQDASQRSLPMLYHLMSENIEEAQETFNQMAQLDGRAGAAAKQINRVGADERGSILSTSYRQIDWMGDSNIQDILSESNFDLREFLHGNMDIFVILPEDQVKEHNRLVRMMMALLMGIIVQANPSELPKNKMLFLLDELAQLGYCPDVEQCIEVLRARGVVVWTVFQTLSQIEQFEKPDLFKGAPLKQIFTNDDTKTMEWIQTLGGKKTVLTKTISENTGDSRQKMQVFGGTKSSGEGESIHETGVDLIQLNEIRELAGDEQFVFLHGAKPIKCKKARYFEHPAFAGKYDDNPVELRNIILEKAAIEI